MKMNRVQKLLKQALILMHFTGCSVQVKYDTVVTGPKFRSLENVKLERESCFNLLRISLKKNRSEVASIKE